MIICYWVVISILQSLRNHFNFETWDSGQIKIKLRFSYPNAYFEEKKSESDILKVSLKGYSVNGADLSKFK